MNRRIAVKNLALLAGAATLLPGCLSHTPPDAAVPEARKPLALSASQQRLLAAVCETLLPRTDTPGAHDLGLPQYVLKMLRDCTPTKEQQLVVAGLGQLDEASRRQQGQSFAASPAAQRLALLQRLDQQPQLFAPALADCYRIVRQLTIDGYRGSEFFMTHEVVYEQVPSRYNGYFPVAQVNLAVPHHGQS